ncbi:MAG: hypothetical protein ACJ8C4_14230 [Gemmataceae bacterium]
MDSELAQRHHQAFAAVEVAFSQLQAIEKQMAANQKALQRVKYACSAYQSLYDESQRLREQWHQLGEQLAHAQQTLSELVESQLKKQLEVFS